MATKTTNYNFVKPELSDVADITAQNKNWDTLDSELKTIVDSAKSTNTELGLTKTMAQSTKDSLPNYQKKITYGTSEPSGGNPGDVYIQLI